MDVVQLHKSSTPEELETIRKRFKVAVVSVVMVRARSDVAESAPRLQSLACASDWLLFDAWSPSVFCSGGNAMSFPWHWMRNLPPLSCPWLVAGGLHEGNVGIALRRSGANGVDVSSGVETCRGVKSPRRIARFIAAARR